MIFPDWGTAPAVSATTLPVYTEWAVDWDKGCFALRNGAPYLVTGAEALKIWVRCALHAESVRYLYSAHSADYGNRLAEMMGESMDRGLQENRLRREIREALLVSPYITAVDGFTFTREGACVTVRFTVHTLYETFDEEVQMP